MLARRTINTFALAITLLSAVFTAGCQHDKSPRMNCRLDPDVTGIKSPTEIENIIKASLLEKFSLTNIVEGYTMYHLTNDSARWLFVQAANAPRGLGVFNLYCYECKEPDFWLLKGYVPVFMSFYTNNADQHLSFQFDNQYLNAIYRREVIYSIKLDVNGRRPVFDGSP